MDGLPDDLRLPYELAAPAVQLATAPPPWRTRGVRDAFVDGLGPVVLAVGGGSVMVAGAGRSAAVDRPWVAVPTTYGPAWALVRPAPVRVLADPSLPAGLPAPLRLRSLAAARAVAVEALWAPDGTPSVRWVALSALRSLHRALTGGEDDPADASGALLRAALLAAVGASAVAPGLLSVLARCVERRGVAWSSAMAGLLPSVAAAQGEAARDALATVADVAGRSDWREAVDVLRWGAPLRLDPATARAVAGEVARMPQLAPRPLDATELERLLVGSAA